MSLEPSEGQRSMFPMIEELKKEVENLQKENEKLQQQLKNCNLQNANDSALIKFGAYLTGHDESTIEQMLNDYNW